MLSTEFLASAAALREVAGAQKFHEQYFALTRG